MDKASTPTWVILCIETPRYVLIALISIHNTRPAAALLVFHAYVLKHYNYVTL